MKEIIVNHLSFTFTYTAKAKSSVGEFVKIIFIYTEARHFQTTSPSLSPFTFTTK